jgi:type I restriction enzyme M protein
LPQVPDAWIDRDKTKVGYEIPFTRHFYVHQPQRSLDEIDRELYEVTRQILDLLGEAQHDT